MPLICIQKARGQDIREPEYQYLDMIQYLFLRDDFHMTRLMKQLLDTCRELDEEMYRHLLWELLFMAAEAAGANNEETVKTAEKSMEELLELAGNCLKEEPFGLFRTGFRDYRENIQLKEAKEERLPGLISNRRITLPAPWLDRMIGLFGVNTRVRRQEISYETDRDADLPNVILYEEGRVIRTNLPDPYLAILQGDLELVKHFYDQGYYQEGYLEKRSGVYPYIKSQAFGKTCKGEEKRAVSNVITAALYSNDPAVLRFLLSVFPPEQIKPRREMLFPLAYADLDLILLFLERYPGIWSKLASKDLALCTRYPLLKGYLEHQKPPTKLKNICWMNPKIRGRERWYVWRTGRLLQCEDEKRQMDYLIFRHSGTEELRFAALHQIFENLDEEEHMVQKEPNSMFAPFSLRDHSDEGVYPVWDQVLQFIREQYPSGTDITPLLKAHASQRLTIFTTFMEAAIQAQGSWHYRVDLYSRCFQDTLACGRRHYLWKRILGRSLFFSILRPTHLEAKRDFLSCKLVFHRNLWGNDFQKTFETAMQSGYFGPENIPFIELPEHCPNEVTVALLQMMQDQAITDLI